MKEFQIGTNEAGQRFDKYLRKRLPKAPDSFLYKMLRKKNIVLNGKKAEGRIPLKQGDTVTIYLSDDTFAKFSASAACPAFQQMEITCEAAFDTDISGKKNKPDRLRQPQKDAMLQIRQSIIYEDIDILVLNKPAGMLSQKASPGDVSANELIVEYLLGSGALDGAQAFRPSVCNRLDRNTSGILVAGKTLRGLQEMSAQLRERTAAKYYLCIVRGRLEQERYIKGWLAKDPEKNQSHIYETERPDSRPIETSYRPLQQSESYTLLEVHLITGRPHQIRAHLASIGHPIIGDAKYGDLSTNRYFLEHYGLRHQLLHAYRMVLKDGREFTAPLPELFCTIMKELTITPERNDSICQPGIPAACAALPWKN